MINGFEIQVNYVFILRANLGPPLFQVILNRKTQQRMKNIERGPRTVYREKGRLEGEISDEYKK